MPLSKNKGFFHTEHFISLCESIFIDAINATGNAGQIGILNEIYENSIPILISVAEAQRKPSKTVLKSLFIVASSPEKYNAVSEILLEVAIKISKAWDDAYAGDSQGQAMFMQTAPEDYINTPPSTNALMYGFRASFYGRP